MPYESKREAEFSMRGHYNSFRESCKRNGAASTPNQIRRNGAKSMLRRYSLAAVSQAQQSYVQKSTTSNLVGMSYMSAHIDSKSPGYSSRVVQYSEEQEKPVPVCQSRHYSLGNFPVVHFFKKDLPLLKPKIGQSSDNVSSELSSYNSPEHNKMLLKRIVRPNPESVAAHKTEVNTQSVLDALREISRKRIHSDEEEFSLNKEGKRMCLERNSDPSARRTKPNSSPRDVSKSLKSSPANSNLSLLNELTASQSSTEGHLDNEPKKVKRIREHISPQPEKPITRVELVDVETQTPAPVEPTPVPQDSPKDKTPQEEEPPMPKKVSPVRIFDEKPLEAMRRNKLVVLMGAKSPDTKNKVPETTATDTKPSEAPAATLVSILAGTVKPADKVAKHVTFNIPESSSESAKTPDVESPKPGVCIVTKTSTSLVTPIVFPSVVETAPPAKATIESSKIDAQVLTLQKPVISSVVPSSASILSTSSSIVTAPISFNFGVKPTANSTSASSTSSFGLSSQTSLSKTAATSSQNSFNLTNQAGLGNSGTPIITQNSFTLTNQTSLGKTTPTSQNSFNFSGSPFNKMPEPKSLFKSGGEKGGFKFELKETSAPALIVTTQNSFVSSGFSLVSTASQSVPKPTAKVVSSAFQVPLNPMNSTVVTSSAPAAFNTQTTASSLQNNSLTFPSKNTIPPFSTSANLITKCPPFKFTSGTAAEAPAPNFNVFAPNSKPAFGPTTTASSIFNSPNFNMQPSSTTFGVPTFTKADTGFTNAPIFQAPKPAFDLVTTPSMSSTAPIFGSTTKSVFGVSSSSAFSTNTPSTTNIFGGFGTTTTTAPTFPSQSAPAFAATAALPSQSAPAFAATAAPFGSSTQFGFNTPAPFEPPASSGNFGQSASNAFAPAFGGGSSFDKPAENLGVAPFANTSFDAGFGRKAPASQSQVFNFGSSAATKPAVFSFGAAESQKSFGFGAAPEQNSNVFGNKGFGGAQFGPVAGPEFGVQPVTGMFNIGSGGSSTPSRSRQQIKPKRRT